MVVPIGAGRRQTLFNQQRNMTHIYMNYVHADFMRRKHHFVPFFYSVILTLKDLLITNEHLGLRNVLPLNKTPSSSSSSSSSSVLHKYAVYHTIKQASPDHRTTHQSAHLFRISR